MDYFDYRPQRFYLLASSCRRLFSFESTDRTLEHAVEEAFAKIPKIIGGNVYALYKFIPSMLEVMNKLSEQWKSLCPNVQHLPSFFRQLKENDIFIRHQAWAPLCDLKRSLIKLRAITEGRDPNKDDEIFVLNWGRLYLKYDTYSFGFLTDKIWIGEEDVSKRVCRFCGATEKERFTKEAHAIMDGLGNKLLFCNEECDKCNQTFESTVERHLYKFLEINRTLSRIKGKNTKKHHLEGLNFHIHPDPKTSQPIVYVMQERIINNLYKGKVTGKLLLYNKGEMSYNGVFKALTKIAVDMIPSDKINHFANTGRWVHGDIEGEYLPCFLYGEHQTFFEQPELDLFFRNEKSPSYSPYCTAILYIFDSIFIYALPFCDADRDRFKNSESLRAHWDLFKKYQYLYVSEWAEYDSNDKTMLTPFYKIPIFPENNEYRIEIKPSTDEIFEIKRSKVTD